MPAPAPKRSTSSYVVAAFGAVLMLISAPCVVTMIHDIITKADNLSGALTAGTFFFVLGLIGLTMTWWGIRKPREQPYVLTPDRERKLLHLVRQHEGVMTVSQLAADSPLTLHQCRKSLEALEMAGVCHSMVTASGGIAYHFPDFLPSGNRTEDDVRFDFEKEGIAAPAEHESGTKRSDR